MLRAGFDGLREICFYFILTVFFIYAHLKIQKSTPVLPPGRLAAVTRGRLCSICSTTL